MVTTTTIINMRPMYDDIVKKVGINDDAVIGLFMYGSRVYGNARKNSDWDYIMIVNDGFKVNEQYSDNLINVNIYTETEHRHRLSDMEPSAMEVACLPEEFILLNWVNGINSMALEKIIELVSKYKPVLKSSELFIAAFPDDAVMIMRSYVENTVALCGKKPLFYVIAEEQMFKEEYKKKDPILLAQSPFGCYWQILGAWDKEMILLQEL